jgi:hypothetical protein
LRIALSFQPLNIRCLGGVNRLHQIDLSRLEAIQNAALLAHIRRVGQIFYERARDS